MQIFEDTNGKIVINGSIIRMNQTINGYSDFLIMNTNPLDIRYLYDINVKYQYDKEQLLEPCKLSGEIDFEIVGDIYAYFKIL